MLSRIISSTARFSLVKPIYPNILCNRLCSSQLDFAASTKEAQQLQNNLDNNQKLAMYGLYKQATMGDVSGKRPGMMDFVGRAKYDAWQKLQGLTKAEAEQKYCNLISSLTPKSAEKPASSNVAPDGLSPMDGLDITVGSGAMRITLNRPKKYNAITWEMYDGITDALNFANENDNISVTVLSGTGAYFSSGNDLSNFAQIKSPEDVQQMAEEGRRVLNRYVNAYINHNKTLVALINGPAVGIAVTTLALCDLVLAADKATFHTPFTVLGQSPEACSSYTFPNLMGHSKAFEMLIYGRKLNAQEAFERNLVTEVLPSSSFVEESERRVNALLELPKQSLVCNKKLLVDIHRKALLSQCERENNLLMERWMSDECMQAIIKFISRKQSKI